MISYRSFKGSFCVFSPAAFDLLLLDSTYCLEWSEADNSDQNTQLCGRHLMQSLLLTLDKWNTTLGWSDPMQKLLELLCPLG